jgi:hypothetical protein
LKPADFIPDKYEAKSDITLAELKFKLAARGTDADIGPLWRFFDRRRITLKKDGARGRTTAP